MTIQQTFRNFLDELKKHVKTFFDVARHRNVLLCVLLILSFSLGAILF